MFKNSVLNSIFRYKFNLEFTFLYLLYLYVGLPNIFFCLKGFILSHIVAKIQAPFNCLYLVALITLFERYELRKLLEFKITGREIIR